jgi:hypothetical protein
MPLLGVVAAVLAFAGVMLGWIFLDLGQIAQVNHIDLLTAAATVGDTEAGWGGVLSDPFASPVDWAFFAVAMFVAFRFAAGARLGLARRTAPTRSARSSGALMADEETEPDERGPGPTGPVPGQTPWHVDATTPLRQPPGCLFF